MKIAPNAFAEQVMAYLEKQDATSGRLPHIPVQFSPDQVRKAIMEIQRQDAEAATMATTRAEAQRQEFNLRTQPNDHTVFNCRQCGTTNCQLSRSSNA